MDTLNKLKKLGEAAQYDVCAPETKDALTSVEQFIYPASLSGKVIPLLYLDLIFLERH